MIEVVYNKDEGEESNGPVQIPKNIRQVGELGDFRKVYIEDYAYNYIDEYADEGRMCIGILLGRSYKQNNDRYLFIKGAMAVENAEITGNHILFTEETWNGVYDGMKKYFPDHEIMGWYVINSNAGGDILSKLKKSHMDNFAGNEKTLMVVDRTENVKYFSFYENNHLVKLAGYIIYYEKNEKMQNFLVAMRSGRRIEEESDERVKGSFRKLLKEDAKPDDSRRSVFISYAANAVMVVMILFIGMSMMNNHQKADKISGELEAPTLAADMPTSLQVIEINGNVYPEVSAETGELTAANGKEELTQEPTALQQQATEAPTETVTEAPTEAATSSEPVVVTPKQYKTYEIKKGETLISLSKKFYGDTSMIDEIMELNDIKDRDYVYEGQIIKLP